MNFNVDSSCTISNQENHSRSGQSDNKSGKKDVNSVNSENYVVNLKITNNSKTHNDVPVHFKPALPNIIKNDSSCETEELSFFHSEQGIEKITHSNDDVKKSALNKIENKALTDVKVVKGLGRRKKQSYSRLKCTFNSDSEDEGYNQNKLFVDGVLNGDDETVHSKVKKRKKFSVLDSDSESETKITHNNTSDALQKGDLNAPHKRKRKLKKLAVINSESEPEPEISDSENVNLRIKVGTSLFNELKKKSRDLDGNDLEVKNETIDNENSSTTRVIDTVNGRGNIEECNIYDYRARLTAICDPESSDDDGENRNDAFEPESRATGTNSKKPQNEFEHPVDKVSKKMTGKQALEQRKEIQSESQRRLRELRVSLPYHKPKARSLTEFLRKRPRFASALPNNTGHTTPSVAIKMSAQQLETMTKKLKEREKEVEKFFKSESESDDESQDELISHNVATSGTQDIESGEIIKETGDINGYNSKLQSPLCDNLVTVSEDLGSGDKMCNINNTDKYRCNEASGDVCIGENQGNVDGSSFNQLDNVSPDLIGDSRNKLVHNDASRITENRVSKRIDKSGSSSLQENNAEPIIENRLTAKPASLINVSLQHTESNTGNEFIAEEADVLEEIKSVKEKLASDSLEFEFNLSDEDFGEDLRITNEEDHDQEMLNGLKKTCSNHTAVGNNLDGFSEEGDCDNIKNGHKMNETENQETVQEKKKTRFELLKETLGNFTPQLSGGPNQVINLGEGVAKPHEITELMERFVQNASRKSHQKAEIHVDVISFVDGEICKEKVSVPVDVDEELLVITEKPGAKLKKLRDELQTQMAEHRSQLWLQKRQSRDYKKCGVKAREKSEYDEDDAMLDDEEEGEFSETESEEDAYMDDECVEKPRKKLAFADEEAEESEGEGDGYDDLNAETVNTSSADVDDADEGTNGEDEELEDSDDDQEDGDGDDESEEAANGAQQKKRKLRRIVKPFSNDSDEENSKDFDLLVEGIVMSDRIWRKNTSLDDSTDTWDESGPPPNQPGPPRTPRRSLTQSKSELAFLTPVIRLTGLRSFDSCSKFLHDTPVTPYHLSESPTNSRGLQKELFNVVSDIPITQAVDELTNLIPPDKLSQADSSKENGNEPSDSIVDVPSTQDFLDVCSGSFSISNKAIVPEEIDHSRSKQEFARADEKLPFSRDNEETTTKTGGESADFSVVETVTLLNTDAEIENLNDDNDDKLISQLLNEEEMEEFKKKFESPLIRPIQNSEPVSVSKAGRFIFDSSDEETNADGGKLMKKKKQKKLVFLDNEDESDVCNDGDDEEIDLHDACDDDYSTDVKSRAVDYDSEENEIEVDQRGSLKQKFKIADFVEKEAELSESEWGSADEDENGLDELEFEIGDAENIDENKIRRDLERIHMRRVLDDDKREVKILQELLLDDGELHGTGRQRQFRWRNIDSVDDENEHFKEDDVDVYVDDHCENEEDWRKLRYQRETFLLEQEEKSQKCDDDVSLSCSSQVLKLGQAAVKRSMLQTNTPSDESEPKVLPDDIIQPFTLLNKRGSFLARSDQVLTRLAEYTKVTGTGACLKTSKNFIFQSRSTEIDGQATVSANNKRKASDGTPNAIKKLRLNNLSPAVGKKSERNNRTKKLFSNW